MSAMLSVSEQMASVLVESQLREVRPVMEAAIKEELLVTLKVVLVLLLLIPSSKLYLVSVERTREC